MKTKKLFAKYVSQNVLGTIGVSCYILADAIFISRAAGTDGLTVLNLVLPVYGIIFAIGQLIAMGSAIRFSLLRGKRDESADDYFANALFWTAVFSVPFICLGIFAPQLVLGLVGADAQIAALGQSYTRIFLCFTPFFMWNFVVTAHVRNDNAPGIAMAAVLISSLFNIVMDYILVFPLGLGLPGAALATAVSPIVGMLICSAHFFSDKCTIRFRWKKLSIRCLGQSAQLGISAFVGEMSSAVTIAVFNFLLLWLVGNVGVAAYGVVANLAYVVSAIFNGISQGSQPLISWCCGAGQKRDMNRLFLYGVVTALVFSVAAVILGWCATDFLVSIFNSEHSVELATYAHTALRLYFLGFLFAGFNIVATGYFSATDQPKAASLTSVLRGVVAIIACACIMAVLFGLNGVWLSFAAAEMITTVVILILLVRKRSKA